MKRIKKAISLVILSGLAAQMTGCGQLDMALPQIKQIGQNIQTLAENLEDPNALNANSESGLDAPTPPEIEQLVTDALLEDEAEEMAPAGETANPDFAGMSVRQRLAKRLATQPKPAGVKITQMRDLYLDTHRLGSEVLYKLSFRIPDRFPDRIEQNKTVKLAQFNHPGQGERPMIVVRYGERNGIPGIVILHRKNPRDKARVVGKAPLRKGAINHLLFHVKWADGPNGFFRALYKAPQMEKARNITGFVKGKNVYAPGPRVLKVGIFPGLQAKLDGVLDGRQLMQALLREAPVAEVAETSEETAETENNS